MTTYKISYIGDKYISNVHHIGINYNGNYYSVVFGEYVNGGFFSIPNWDCGGELATYNDVLWNAESIGRVIKSKKIGMMIAMAIAEFTKDSQR